MSDIATSTLVTLVERLAGHRVLVVGDVMLDEYIVGDTQRLSREAPIPVLEFVSQRDVPGGAANPSMTLQRLGSQAVQLGIVGQDAVGQRLRDALEAHGIDCQLVTDPSRPTTLKTRLMARMGLRFPQQVARIDRLSREPIATSYRESLLDGLQAALPGCAAVLVSDYRSGLLDETLAQRIRHMTQAAGRLLLVDAQGELAQYSGYDVIKCNADEASQFLGQSLGDDASFARAARTMMALLAVRRALVITRGADGATLATPADGIADGTTDATDDTADSIVQHIRSPQVRDVFDTVGAGDTSIAVMALALLAAASPVDAVRLANIASGIVVQHVGNHAPSPTSCAMRSNGERVTVVCRA